uniref:Uncharacterized protein n=1 Tax=Anguilla anguilla TaxID=7936 RepID=A0A0E9W6D0_ANGAN
MLSDYVCLNQIAGPQVKRVDHGAELYIFVTYSMVSGQGGRMVKTLSALGAPVRFLVFEQLLVCQNGGVGETFT